MNKIRAKIIALDIVSLVLMLNISTITEVMFDKMPKCVFLQMGIQCMSCGSTRCVRSMASLDFASAIRYNPITFFVVIYIGVVIALLNIGYIFKIGFAVRLNKYITHTAVIVIFAAAYAVFGLLRNIG